MTAANPTMSHVFGELTWLLTQSPLHRHLKLADLEWLIMPPLLHRQFYVFRDGDKTIGVALWAKMSAAVEEKLNKPLLDAENRLTPEDWASGENIWLIDLVAPFATAENRHREIMIADLIAGPLKAKRFNLHKTDPKTGQREVVRVEADASEKLKSVVEKAAAGLQDGKVH